MKNRLYTYFLSLIMFTWGQALSATSVLQQDTSDLGVYQEIGRFDKPQKALRHCKAVIDTILANRNFIDTLTNESLLHLPIGIKSEINNVKYFIGFDDLRIYPDHLEISVYAKIITPQGKEMIFGSPGVKFSGTGAFLGDTKIGLLSDVTIDIGNKKGLLIINKIDESKGTYLTFDCNGFKNVQLDATLEFSRDWIVPVDRANVAMEKGRVRSDFKIFVNDFNDWLVKINLPNFALTKFPKVAYSVKTAILDFSDAINDERMIFPPNYFEEEGDSDEENLNNLDQNQLSLIMDNNAGDLGTQNNSNNNNGSSYNEGNARLWRGIYIHEFIVTLPKEFAKRDNSDRIAFVARDLLIDSRGVSGFIEAENLIPLEQGRMSKWAYSLDLVGIKMRKSKLQGFEISGKLQLPITGEKETFAYRGGYDKEDHIYYMSVKLTSNITFPAFKVAKVDIARNSSIKVAYYEDKFIPLALLNGKISILASSEGNNGKKELEAPNITFEKLLLTTESPYINIGKLSLGGGISIKGTPVTITKIGFGTRDDMVGINFEVEANFDNQGESGISASIGAGVFGQLSEDEDRHRWVFKKIIAENGTISATFPGFTFQGELRTFENVPVYGSGFQAKLVLGLSFKGDSKYNFEVKAFGIFGHRENPDLKYWLVDVDATFPCIPVFTGLQLCGIMGGAYRRMAPVDVQRDSGSFDLGVLPSGVQYRPEPKAGFGIRAGVKFKVLGEKAIAGTALLEFAFGSTGSLDRIFFQGLVEMKVPIEKVPGLVKVVTDVVNKYDNVSDTLRGLYAAAQKNSLKDKHDNKIIASLTTDLNFSEQVYHSILDVRLDLVNGFIYGAGQADMLASVRENKWHFYLGTFEHKITVGLKISDIVAQVGVYFMLGNDIPGFPPIDPNVAQVLRINSNQVEKDQAQNLPAVATGSGILFGGDARISMQTCFCPVVCIYAKVDFTAGFHAGTLSFPSDQRCANGQGPIGKNGWYSFARAYVIISVEAGRKKNCQKDEHKWADVSLGLFVDAQFPNPTYIYGTGFFKLCKLRFNVEVQKGQKCM